MGPVPRGAKPGQTKFDADDIRATRNFKLACRKLARRDVAKMAPSEKMLAMQERRRAHEEAQIERLGEAYTSCLRDGVKPTYEELNKRSGMAIMTIRRYLEKLTLGMARTKVKAAAENILHKLAERALATGDERKVESYFKLVYDWDNGQKPQQGSGPISITIDTK